MLCSDQTASTVMFDRRKLLISAAACLLPRKACAVVHGNASLVPPPSNLPADVATYGFSAVTFNDNFTSLSDIDLTDSGAPGFKWYLRNAWPNASQTGYHNIPSSDPTGVVLNSPGNGVQLSKGSHFNLVTACTDGADGYHGQVFSGGGYFEISMNFNPALANPANPIWPAFWAHDVGCLEFPNRTDFMEPDFFEAYPSGLGTITIFMAIHDWAIVGGVNTTNNQNPNYIVTLPGSPDLTQFHRYGTLWVPAARNSETGLVKRYFDGVNIPAMTVEYSATTGSSPVATPFNPNGVFSIWDSESIILIISSGAGTGWPVNVNNVIVVQ